MSEPIFGDNAPGNFGWLDFPAQREQIAATFRYPTLSQAAPDLVAAGSERKDVFLYRAFLEVLSAYPPYVAQEIGDCTSHGSGHSGDLTQCLEIVLGDQEEFKELCTEAIYGLGREIAGLQGSWSDGCYGVAVAKAMTEFGVVPREAVGPYSGKRAKEWGGRSGVPREIRDLCGKHKFGTQTLVTTLAEFDAAIDNGYVGFGGSNQGFTMTRDANGVCQPRGRWAHLMAYGWGRKMINGAVHYLADQSWGPNVPSGPTPDNIPNTSFWVHESVMSRILAQRDTLVIGRFDGFPARNLPSSWTMEGWA